MTTFSTAEVARVAALARIELTSEEVERLAGDLEVITASIERVSEAVSGDVPATSHPLPLTNVMRDDNIVPTLGQAAALAGAPAAEDGRFAVPQILGEEA